MSTSNGGIAGGEDDSSQGTSTRPYLLRALHEWCNDNGFTPYIAVHVDDSVRVPREHVKNSEIVLNVGFEATSGLKLGNEFVEFRARFGGVSRDIVVPVDHVIAIYARENGQGMAFPVPTAEGKRTLGAAPKPGEAVPASGAGGQGGTQAGPQLRSVKLATPGEPPSPAPVRAAPEPVTAETGSDADDAAGESPDDPPKGPRPSLKRVK